ncbi:related to tetracycline-efflux transporter [Cephalotrichum gorgonifer]|uniref:Related to tetracycline-efflux transporter n=1 Tax=Cephalotrichum gorgonifer TaxID=2041049 RepID=A0AAE8MUR5_9PEZI|nr:related to tetracycline-efflux transporter [Cephalotrichum gorgonifer]
MTAKASDDVRAGARASAAAQQSPNGNADVTEATPLIDPCADEPLPATGPAEDTWIGQEDFEHLPPWRRPSVYWLLAPWFVFILAFGGTLVPKLNLILELICKEYFDDKAAHDHDVVVLPVIPGGRNEQCQIAPVQRAATEMTLIMSLVTGLLSAIIAPKLGHLSDLYGRTKWLAVSSAGGITAEIITVLAAKFPGTINYRWIILGAAFEGLGGSFTAGSLLSHSYTSDCTPPSRRGVAISYIHACLFSGLAIGPVLAGYFVEHTGSLVSIFYLALGCHIFFALFALLVMPESVSRRRQLLSREKRAKELAEADLAHDGTWLAAVRHRNPFAPLRILYQKQPGAPPLFRRNVITLAAIDMVLMGAAMGAGTCIILYLEFVFKWGNLESSKYISFTSTIRASVLLVVFPLINYVFRTRPAAAARRQSAVRGPTMERNRGADALDLWIIRAALASDVLGSMGYLFARSPAVFVAGGAMTAVGGLGSAMIQASLTKHVPPESVGRLLGAVGLLHGLSRVLSPLMFNGLYRATLETFPGAIFGLLVALFSLSLLASLGVRPHVYIPDHTDSSPERAETDPEGRRSTGEEERLL